MEDGKLRLTHAVERYLNALSESQAADDRRNDAVCKAGKADALLKEAEKALYDECNQTEKFTGYIRTRGDRLIVVSTGGQIQLKTMAEV